MDATDHTKRHQKIRVLRIAHSSLTPALRDRERALARCYPDVELQVLTTHRWREAEVDVEATDDDLFPVRTARPYFSKHIQLFAYDPWPVISALRDHKPDLIDLNHEPYSVACAEILILCKQFAPDVPIVMQTAQNIFRRYPPPFNWFEQHALKRVSAAYVCSETVREVLRAKGFDKPAPIIPFGVNIEAFRPALTPRTRSGRPLTIGFAGRMLPGKGLNVLGEALSRLRLESWQVLLVGDGPEREKFEAKLTSVGLQSRARFTGAIAYEQIPEHFQRMDMLVIPTQTTDRIREQFGRVIVEAMATGVPVVGSTCGAIPEVIDHAGLVVPESDPDALAIAIRRLLADARLRERLSRAGRARVEQRYTWERVAKDTYDLYNQVLKTRNQSVPRSKLELAA